ncbi:hypothetical protein GOBAR_DD02390 [Gossypium barbadense]|nr:hypothetical protein GOBAR_DD02390 [Gossypium barbadense]
MDEVLQGLSLHEKATVELVLDGDARVKDEINYDLCLVGEDPEEINFSFANFWVQGHDLPLGFASEGLAKSLGNTMGMLRLIGVLSGEGSSIVDKGESLDRDQLPKVVESSVGLTGNGSGRGEVKRTCLHGAVSLAKGVVGTLAAFGSKEKYIMDIDESKKRTRPLDCIEGESGVRLGATERFQLPWLCMSDFNNFLSVQDKWGGVSYLDNICRRFQDCIADCGLIEVSLLGPFTWERGSGTAHFVMERLDMAFANARWMQMFPYFKLFNLVSATSDHNPSNHQRFLQNGS